MSGVFGRVVVTFDAVSEHRAAIDAAALLAARTKSPLHGVFLENEELLRLARLPVSRQVAWGPGGGPFAGELVGLHLRAAAEGVRQELAAAAARNALEWSFEIVRGTASDAVAGTGAGDLVVAAALTRPVAGYFRVECRWSAFLQAAPGPFLLVRGNPGGAGSIVVLLRGRDPKSARLLDAAAPIARAIDGPLVVVGPPQAAGFEEWVADRIAGLSLRVRVEAAPPAAAELGRRIAALDCRLLALEAGDAFPEGVACDVLFIR